MRYVCNGALFVIPDKYIKYEVGCTNGKKVNLARKRWLAASTPPCLARFARNDLNTRTWGSLAEAMSLAPTTYRHIFAQLFPHSGGVCLPRRGCQPLASGAPQDAWSSAMSR